MIPISMPWVAVKKFTGQGADRVLQPTFSKESKTSDTTANDNPTFLWSYEWLWMEIFLQLHIQLRLQRWPTLWGCTPSHQPSTRMINSLKFQWLWRGWNITGSVPNCCLSWAIFNLLHSHFLPVSVSDLTSCEW